MTTGTEHTRDPGRLPRSRTTLPFPPPNQNPAPVPIKDLGSEQPSLPENLFLGEPSSWDDPWEGLFDQVPPPRRRWPAVIAFSLAGLFVTLIGISVVNHLRQQSAANASPSERALEPRQEQSTATKPSAAVAVPRVDAVFDSKKSQLPTVEERAAAQPVTLVTNPNAGSTVPPPAATQATGLAPSVGQQSNSATANGPNELTAPIAEKPARAALSPARRRSVPRKPTVHADKSTLKSQAEAEDGTPVDQIYMNRQGELVDAQGKPLPPKTERTEVPLP